MTTLRLLAIAALGVAAPAVAGLPLQQALVGSPGCGHVLDLLLRYGPLEGAGPLTGGTVVPSPHGGFVLPAAEMGDLCLTSVTEAPCDAGLPPKFLVAVTNKSCRAVCNVEVSVVALLGPIKACDPTATVLLKEVPAGATIAVEVCLPAEALAMGDNGGCPVGFQKLLVAVDAFDRYAEVDESNNLSLLCRTDIPKQVLAEAAPITPPEPTDLGQAPPAATGPEPSAIDSALESFGIDTKGEAATSL